MHRTPRNLEDAHEELVQIQEELTRLQERIKAVRDSVANALVGCLANNIQHCQGGRKRIH